MKHQSDCECGTGTHSLSENGEPEAASDHNRGQRSLLGRVAMIGAAGAILIAVLGLLGYVPGLALLGSIREGYIPMAPSTAVSFIVLGGLLLWMTLRSLSGANLILFAALASLVSLFGLLEVAGHFAEMDLNFEDLLVPSAGHLGDIPIARMSPATGMGFFLAGLAALALVLASSDRAKRAHLGHWAGSLGSLVLVLSFIFCLAYLYGTPLLYGRGATVPMAITTALGFLSLGVATVCASGNDSFPVRLWAGTSTFSFLLRFLVPLTALATLLGGFLVPRVTMFLDVNPAIVASATIVLATAVTTLMSVGIARHIAGIITRSEAVRDEAMASLHESEEQFRRGILDAPVPIMIHAEDGEVWRINNVWTELTGYTHDDIPTIADWTCKAYGQSMDDVRAEIDSLFESNHLVHEGEYTIRIKSGQTKTWDFSSGPLGQLPDKRRLVISMATDVTDRKQIEKEREELIAQLEAQNAELERFAYTVSHDLKSPLITINGYVGMLRQDLAEGKSNRVEEDLSRISNAADKMEDLLRDLLELSRIGRLVNMPEDVSLGELAAEASEIVSGQAQQTRVKVEISPDLPTVLGDRIRLLEVLQNLIDNAVKYMGDQSHPLVEIGSRSEGDETICYVRDNGIGIDPRHQERVFGLFDQLDPNVEGSGIGLSLVKRIVEVHGGRIWIESQGSGQGSTFCFTIGADRESMDRRATE